MFDFNEHTHKRLNLLTGEWILVSPHRTKRPWNGKTEDAAADKMPEYDPNCYLCPGNTRAGGVANPKYEDTFLFVNDYSALIPGIPKGDINEENLLIARSEEGICKVICFSPRHDLTLARMSPEKIVRVIDLWIDQYKELGGDPNINYVQIFENRGAIMGCSNPHPHGQIWSSQTVPDLPAKETEKQTEYKEKNGRCLLCDYLALELKKKERIVLENDGFAVLVPFWAVWPYEIMILPKRHMSSIDEMTEKEKKDLAEIMKAAGIRYDNLFKTNFPYSMGIHQKPTDGKAHDEWHFHFHYLPPLLRSATVKKFMVGYELLAMPQRDITAEQAAAKLREQPPVHYLES